MSMPLLTDDPEAADPARAVKRIGESLGIKDFQPQIHHTSKMGNGFGARQVIPGRACLRAGRRRPPPPTHQRAKLRVGVKRITEPSSRPNPPCSCFQRGFVPPQETDAARPPTRSSCLTLVANSPLFAILSEISPQTMRPDREVESHNRCAEGTSVERCMVHTDKCAGHTPCMALAALEVDDCRQNRGGWPLR